MAQDCAGSLHAVRLRVARLDDDGAPDLGAGNLYVSNALVLVGAEVELSEGDDFELKNGAGGICVAYKDRDKLKRLNMTLQLCTPDPQLTQMLVGGDVILDGSDPIGYAYPEIDDEEDPRVSVEVWTHAIVDNHIADTNPFWHWVFPRTKWTIGQRQLENGIMAAPFTGQAEQNDNWGDGPESDWPHISNRLAQYARDDTVPDSVCGSQALTGS